MKLERLISLFGLVMFLGTGSVAAAQWGFDELMDSLSNHPRFSADFTEERSSFFLARPIELTGRIIFVADERLEKIIEKPFSEHFIIDENEIVIHRVNEGGKAATRQTTRFRLEKYPFLARAVQGVSNLFSGDKTLLEEMYDSRLEGSRENWELVLEPSHEKLKEYIDSITVRGSGGIIDVIHTLEADGDESILTLANRSEP